MQNTYVGLANSISNLANTQLVRRHIDINKFIIRTIQERDVALRNSSNNNLLQAHDNKLMDLCEELQPSRRYLKSINERFSTRVEEGKKNIE